MAELQTDSNLDVMPVRSVEPITRLSNIQPFQYTFAVDIGQTWEGTPSTLLQECNSITARNQPLSCQTLCEREGVAEDKMDECRIGKRDRFECCDTAIFNAGKTARVLVDDIFSKGEVPDSILAGVLGEGELLRWSEARTINPDGYIAASEYATNA